MNELTITDKLLLIIPNLLIVVVLIIFITLELIRQRKLEKEIEEYNNKPQEYREDGKPIDIKTRMLK